MAELNFSLVVPSISRDIPILLDNKQYFFSFLPIKDICIIGNEEVKELIPEDYRIRFINESDIIPTKDVKRIFHSICKSANDEKRFGWYLQQFLKLAFSFYCNDEYYLLWDSDTIPVKKIDFFDKDNKPYLDYKTEYYKSYFDTLERILPGYSKSFSGSFIAEHMLVNTQKMRDMIYMIENNSQEVGLHFYEIIIKAIDIEHISKSGFSEFETFGTFLYKNFKNEYSLRRWQSLRHAGFFYKSRSSLNEYECEWLSRSFYAVSFEKSDELSFIHRLVTSRLYMCLFSARSLFCYDVTIRAFRRFRKCFRRSTE